MKNKVIGVLLCLLSPCFLWAQDVTISNKGPVWSQNRPNPFGETTEAYLTTEEPGRVVIEMVDVNSGRKEGSFTQNLRAGTHRLSVTVAKKGTYLLSACQNGRISSIKIMCYKGAGSGSIRYIGMVAAFLDGGERENRPIRHIQSDLPDYTLLYAGPDEDDDADLQPSQEEADDFRVALSLSPWSLRQFEEGYTFEVGDSVAETPAELQKIYCDLGATEMYCRIATKRHVTEEPTDDENANAHTLDQGLGLCRVAAELGIPINPEIMCAYTYMDMEKQQAPRFDEYPEFYGLQHGKKWEELSLDEICAVLYAYGAFVGEEILKTGCTVNNWNLGNEANFGFAGISMGLETAVNPKLKKRSDIDRYLYPTFARWWLKKHLWKYDAKAYAAVKSGILSAYDKLGMDASNVKFSTHIATVVFSPKCSKEFFKYMAENGYTVETAGISYYPSAPSMSANKKQLLKKTVSKINKKCGVPVFIGEFSYPSGPMDGPFAGWNKTIKGYKHTPQGQADIYADVISWGKKNGMAGIRYWAPDYEGWYAMSMFNFSNKKGTAKPILLNHKGLIER